LAVPDGQQALMQGGSHRLCGLRERLLTKANPASAGFFFVKYG
jgi:hypothetical protein